MVGLGVGLLAMAAMIFVQSVGYRRTLRVVEEEPWSEAELEEARRIRASRHPITFLTKRSTAVTRLRFQTEPEWAGRLVKGTRLLAAVIAVVAVGVIVLGLATA